MANTTMDWMQIKTYAGLRNFSDNHAMEMSPEQRIGLVERMRQLRFGYEHGTLKMDKTAITMYSPEEFRAMTEHEYEREIEKYGPR